MINAQTQLYGIIGNPLQHSLSPIIHNGAFKRMGMNAVYLTFEIENLTEAMIGIRGLGIRGVSVTIPFKTQVAPYLDQVDGIVGEIKAINTISNEGGKLTGYNTDWCGAMEALEEKVDLRNKRVIILGAGGAARAIAWGLRERNCKVFIINRSPDKARNLASEFGFNYSPISCMNALDPHVIINATSVGMYPNNKESPLPKEVLKAGMTVMDIVYHPLKTKLLREAEERGCQTIDGLEMLARQGTAQFQIWTGRRPEVGKVKEDLRWYCRNKWETF